MKEAILLCKLSPEEAGSLVNDLTELIRDVIILEPRGLEQKNFRIVVSEEVTVYDSSYIALAAKHNLILVTEDQKVSRKASSIVNVMST